jgi:hypothetical protein
MPDLRLAPEESQLISIVALAALSQANEPIEVANPTPWAPPLDPSRERLLRELLAVSRAVQAVSHELDRAIRTLEQSSPESARTLAARLDARIGPREITELLLLAYDRSLALDEIRELLECHSPATSQRKRLLSGAPRPPHGPLFRAA